jgi:hypothetical protein
MDLISLGDIYLSTIFSLDNHETMKDTVCLRLILYQLRIIIYRLIDLEFMGGSLMLIFFILLIAESVPK